jgi:uncharacterized damage-inducible protein DinB
MQPRLHIITDCIGLLEQAKDLIQRVADDVFTATTPISPRGSIGAHLRHIMDFYQNFLLGLELKRIDYNLRQRDPRLEQNRLRALENIEATIRSLRKLTAVDYHGHLLVSSEADTRERPIWIRSSVFRELEFVKSHTIHHYSLIAMLLRLHEIDPGEGFGVAPSTLSYWKEEAACAR